MGRKEQKSIIRRTLSVCLCLSLSVFVCLCLSVSLSLSHALTHTSHGIPNPSPTYATDPSVPTHSLQTAFLCLGRPIPRSASPVLFFHTAVHPPRRAKLTGQCRVLRRARRARSGQSRARSCGTLGRRTSLSGTWRGPRLGSSTSRRETRSPYWRAPCWRESPRNGSRRRTPRAGWVRCQRTTCR